MSTKELRVSLMEQLKNVSKRQRKEVKDVLTEKHLSPFTAATSVFNDRLRVSKTINTIVISVSVIALSVQEYRVHGIIASALNKSYFIIPGAVDIMKMRPGMLPDSAVYYFADHIVEQIGNFNYLNVEGKYSRLSEFMTPQMREKFNLELRKKLPVFKEMAVTENFMAEPVKGFKLTKDAQDNPIYYIEVPGKVVRYTNEQRLPDSEEVVFISFRTTTKISSEKPWAFEIVSLARKSKAEFEEMKAAQDAVTSQNSKGDKK